MAIPARVLVVAKSTEDSEFVLRELRAAGIDPESKRVDSPQSLRDALAESSWDVVISEYRMNGFDGLSALEVVQEAKNDLPVILVSETPGEEAAVEAMKRGCRDYFLKDRLSRLPGVVRRELEQPKNTDASSDAKQTPRLAELRYRDLVENTTDLVQSVAPDGFYLFANRPWRERLGYTEEDLKELSIFDVIHPDEHLHCRQMFEHVQQGNSAKGVRTTFITRTGEKVHVEGNATGHIVDGAVVATQSVFRDITDTVEAQQALELSAKQWQTTFDAMPDAVFLLSNDHEILRCNRQATVLLGKAETEILGQKCWKILHGTDSPPDSCLHHKMQESRERVSTVLPRDDRIYSLSVDPVTDAAGDMTGSIHIVRDITERTQAEQALARETEFTSKSLDAQMDTFFLFDPATGKALRWNKSFSKQSGYSDEEIAELPAPKSYYAEGDLERAGEFIYQVMREGAGTIDLDLICKDGRRIPTEYRVSTVSNEKGEPKYFISVGRDVSERKRAEEERRRLEEQLRQSQKMEAIGQLAGGVAHDFNNMLGAIIGYSDILMNSLREGDPAKDDVGQIREAAGRAASLTRQLLAFSRKQVLEPRVTDLNAIVVDMDMMLRRLIGEDVELIAKLDKGLERVKVDPNQIHQVIMNLAVNARDAMPQGGKLTIETANVTLDQTFARDHVGVEAGPHVLLAISDNGAGMDESTRQRIFDPFFTTKEMGKGSGLGLSTVYGIVTQSNGTIWVDSAPGKGTNFKIYLPCVEGEPVAPEPSSGVKASPKGSETILVAEDEGVLRGLVTRILKIGGYRVIEAANGGEALLIMRKESAKVDMLITDVVMPRMSGRQLADEATGLRDELKVLYISGYTDDAIVRHGIRESNMPFLQKPFSASALMNKVRSVLDGKATAVAPSQ